MEVIFGGGKGVQSEPDPEMNPKISDIPIKTQGKALITKQMSDIHRFIFSPLIFPDFP